MENDLRLRIAEWLEFDKNPKTRKELNALVIADNLGELRRRLCNRMSFGTAGMRAPMQTGNNSMNDLTIVQTTQGMLGYMQRAEVFGEKITGVVVGYDTRHNSLRFARLVANVFIAKGITVYLYREHVPTPLVPYTIAALGCQAGVMVTASHNPKEDNGYKAYWANGAQILQPIDAAIEREVLLNLRPTDGVFEEEKCLSSPLCHDPRKLADGRDILELYYETEAKLCTNQASNAASALRICYTPVHGVGQNFTPRFLRAIGFDHVFDTPEQSAPDPDFTTVPFPNPEEGRCVLEWAITAADANDCSIVLANDPDADRIQLAERQADKEWYIFSGNEMGAILANFMWVEWRERNLEKKASVAHFLNSAVSSKIVGTMSKVEGFTYHETLTGFKWMGNMAEDILAHSPTEEIILGWEESIGYMPGASRDKDGVLSAGLFAEVAAIQKLAGSTVYAYLQQIYAKYGHHIVRSSYFINRDVGKTRRFFAKMRFGEENPKEPDNKDELQYPEEIAGLKVEFVRDLTIGYDNQQKDNKPVLPITPTAQMITFTLEGGMPLTIRASGTEPKIKYYFEMIGKPGTDSSTVIARLNELEARIIKEFIQPDVWGFEARK